MKRKILTSLLVCILAFTMTACSKAEDTFDEDEIESVSEEDYEDEDENDEDSEDKDGSLLDKLLGKESEEESTEESTEESVEESVEESIEESVEESVEESSEEPVEESIEESSEEPEITEPVVTPTELSDDLYSFQISIDGTIYEFPMWYDQFEAMGWTFKDDPTVKLYSNQYSLADRWEKDDVTIYSQLANLTLNAAPLSKCTVASITLDNYDLEDSNWEIILPKGIKYGVSTRDDILAAYGTPSDEYEGSSYYKMTYEYKSYQEVVLYVYLETGTLDKIEIQNMIEIEGGDNSVSEEVPEAVKNYVAPTELGNDLFQYIVQVQGSLYQLPVPVSEFLNNGFQIVEDESQMVIGAGSFGRIELRHGNYSFSTTAWNTADYATIPSNCFITDIDSSIYDEGFEMIVVGNLKCGDSGDAMLEALKDFDYELSESGDYSYYNFRDPNRSSIDYYQFCVKENEIVSIDVQYDFD